MTVEYCSVVSEVAKQNDIFRQAILDPGAAIQVARQGIIGQIVLTPGIAEEAEDFRQSVLAAVAQFDTFTEDVESRWCALPHC
jgi:hypothetical protein